MEMIQIVTVFIRLGGKNQVARFGERVDLAGIFVFGSEKNLKERPTLCLDTCVLAGEGGTEA